MQQASVSSDIRHIVDLGCSTGLSSLELHKTFPSAQITAIDLSPHFVAVAKGTQQLRQVSCAHHIHEQVCIVRADKSFEYGNVPEYNEQRYLMLLLFVRSSTLST